MSEKDLHSIEPEQERIPVPEPGLENGVMPDAVDVSHPADAADHIEALDIPDQVKFVKQLPVKDAAWSRSWRA